MHGVDLGGRVAHGFDVPQLDVGAPYARTHGETAGHEIVVEGARVVGRVGVQDTRGPQVTHEANLRLIFGALEVFDEFPTRVETPVVGHAENSAKEAVRR